MENKTDSKNDKKQTGDKDNKRDDDPDIDGMFDNSQVLDESLEDLSPDISTYSIFTTPVLHHTTQSKVISSTPVGNISTPGSTPSTCKRIGRPQKYQHHEVLMTSLSTPHLMSRKMIKAKINTAVGETIH